MLSFRKRKHDFHESVDHFLEISRQRTAKRLQETDNEFVPIVASVLENLRAKRVRKRRDANIERDQGWWNKGYQEWSDKEFKKKLRVNGQIFDFLLDKLRPVLEKTSTNLIPNPTIVDRQIASTLYRYAHGSSFLTIGDLFGISKESACTIFHTRFFFYKKR